MALEEYQDLRGKEKRMEWQKESLAFDKLSKSAHTINVLAALIMALFWVAAILVFINWKGLKGSALTLFLSGCVIGVIGEAVSRTMEALAEHMKDTRKVRNDMDRLMSRIERRS